MSYLDRQIAAWSADKVRAEIIEAATLIGTNDGRQSADSSMDLDYALDRLDAALGRWVDIHGGTR